MAARASRSSNSHFGFDNIRGQSDRRARFLLRRPVRHLAISFPRFTRERMPGRFASACRQAVAESRTNRLERRRGREASERHSHVKRGNEAERGNEAVKIGIAFPALDFNGGAPFNPEFKPSGLFRKPAADRRGAESACQTRMVWLSFPRTESDRLKDHTPKSVIARKIPTRLFPGWHRKIP